eukprot:141334-Pyramimonas_sp.AAC.1
MASGAKRAPLGRKGDEDEDDVVRWCVLWAGVSVGAQRHVWSSRLRKWFVGGSFQVFANR